MDKNKILVVCDGSYFCYYVLFGAVTKFVSRYPSEANVMIKPADLTDLSNLPNLLNSDNFRKILKEMTMKRCETMDWILQLNFLDLLDIADQIDTVFALDDNVINSFRKGLYPEYKLQRAFAPKSFQTLPIKDYIINVIFKELEVESKYGYHMLKVDNAEGDDVIACLMRDFEGYSLKVLFASDHDFLQIAGIKLFDLKGNEVKRIVGDEELSAEDYLMSKLLLGDGADNIPKVFAGVGQKKVLKLVHDHELLKSKLKESQDAVKQFKLNKQLISFTEIPEDLRRRVIERANESVFKLQQRKEEFDLADFMSL